MPLSRSWSTIEVHVDGDVAYVRFNRPEHKNAVTTAMVIEMDQALTELATDDSLSVVVLTGNGTTFCPGADLSARAKPRSGDAPRGLPDLSAYNSALLLREMPQVTVAVVNGGCAGPGMAWASACDLRIATSRARFSTAFLEVGLAGELGLSWTLEQLLGAAIARDLCFLPRKMAADELQRLGFLSQVFPDETFQADADAFVAALAARGRSALRALKANFVDAGRMPLREYLAVESARHQSFFQ